MVPTISTDKTRILYTPQANFVGTDTLTYTISDGNGGTAQATVTVNVVEFIPSSLSGFVYYDTNNDGIRDASEQRVAGVTITLTGTDYLGAAVSRRLRPGATEPILSRNWHPAVINWSRRSPRAMSTVCRSWTAKKPSDPRGAKYPPMTS